jgi:nitrite reductase (cytochrome c-552)
MPEQKIERDPWLKRMFLGYAFSIDYRDRRGHAYMLADQEETERLTKPQSGSCLHCHASVMPLYRKLGDGDAMAGFEKTYAMSYQELNGCCTRWACPPGILRGLPRPGNHATARDAAGLHEWHPGWPASDAATPHLPSVEQWRQGDRAEPYDPNQDATRNEMRSFVCGQCHVEYYCSSEDAARLPMGQRLARRGDGAILERDDLPGTASGSRLRHAETGAEILKAQHPEFELWSQGIHARSGVSCADCHMPYMREGRRQGVRPLGPQSAAERQPRLPDLPPHPRGRDPGAGGRDPGPQPQPAAAGRRPH